jgi:outer membrane protein, multidrug efflux system
MSSQTGTWSSGAQVSQPIFTGGALRGNLRVAKSQHQQALIAYQQAIQRAFGDVSDAIIAYQNFHQVRVRQEDSIADLQESVRLSNMRYKRGTTTYLEVLDCQGVAIFRRTHARAGARHRAPESRELYRGFGGGWKQ